MIARYSVAVFIVCAWLLSGCAVNPAATEAEEKSKIPLESARAERDGLVFLTLGTQQPKPFSSVTVDIRPRGQGARTFMEDFNTRPHLNRARFSYKGSSIGTFPHFSDSTEEGQIFVAALPPGEYEIFDLTFRWGNYIGSSNPYISIPFRVIAGEAIYLGRFIGKLTGTTEGAALGGLLKYDTPDKAFFAVRENLSADSTLLEKQVASNRGFKLVDGYSAICAKPMYLRCNGQ